MFVSLVCHIFQLTKTFQSPQDLEEFNPGRVKNFYIIITFPGASHSGKLFLILEH